MASITTVTLLVLSVSVFAADPAETTTPNALGDQLFTLKVKPILQEKCVACHGNDQDDLKGDFSLRHLGEGLNDENFYLWEDSLDFVNTNEMPPPEKSELSEADREKDGHRAAMPSQRLLFARW